MRAAVVTGPRQIELVERDLPPTGRGQVRVRIDQCGVCTSELDVWTGEAGAVEYPVAIGHEAAGTVEDAAEDVASPRVGDRVALWQPGGGFAEHAVVDAAHCFQVAPGITYPAVAEPLACVVNAVEFAAPALADDVVIVGAGFMGNLVQLVTALKGPRSLTVADVRPDALSRAAELGATRVVDISSESLPDVVREVTDGRGADLTYEVTGVTAGLELAGKVTRMSGKVCIVGYHQGGTRAIPLGNWNWMAFNLVNAHFREPATILSGMRAGMRLVNAGVLDPSGLLTRTYPLDGISAAFEAAADKPVGFVKAVVDPTSP
jgi:L-iditol 2-dehydrogenase